MFREDTLMGEMDHTTFSPDIFTEEEVPESSRVRQSTKVSFAVFEALPDCQVHEEILPLSC